MPPRRASTLALFQKLSYDFDFSLMYHHMSAMVWRGDSDRLPSRRRVDARLAYPFRMGDTRAEAALVVQAANGAYAEFLPSQNFLVEKRAFGTLRFEF